MNLKQMIANADACKPYWIDTAVYFSASIAKKKGGTRWAAGTDALPALPGMTCHPTAGGYFRYCVNEKPTDCPDTWKEPRLALLAQHGIPVQETKARKAKPAPADPTVGIVARRHAERKAAKAKAEAEATPKTSPWAEPMRPKAKAPRKAPAPATGKPQQLTLF
jgi:hypothetical protein